MTAISMRLPDADLQELDRRAAELRMSRTEYLRKALDAMNRAVDRERRKSRIKDASLKVRAESLRVNAEFAAIEHAPD